jgi:hypothetical protein
MTYSVSLMPIQEFTDVDYYFASKDFVDANAKAIYTNELSSTHFTTDNGVTLFYSNGKITDINQVCYYVCNCTYSFDESDELVF